MGKELQPMDISAPGQNLEAYLNSIQNIAILSPEEERKLAEDLYYREDLEAARQLVMAHLRFVVHIARGYSGYGLPQEDLIQEGNVGLMKAVRKFNPEVGVRLISFAVHWIKSEIHEYVLKNWKIVKVATTKAQRKLFFDYLTNEDSDPMEIVEKEDFARDQINQLQSAISDLDERSQLILKERWLTDDKPTLHELADKYGISAERIRQIEKKAMEKIRTNIN